jgi:hypothetical protein
LNLVNPNNNTIYSNTLPLNFDVDWSASVVPWFGVQFSYSIDNGVKIHTNGGGNYNFKNTSSIITTTTTTNDTVNISDLTIGLHKVTIFADGSYDLDNLFVPNFNYTFSPIFFSVNILPINPTSTPSPTPSPSVPEFSYLNNQTHTTQHNNRTDYRKEKTST